ncbi:transposase-like protein [Bradyrhizobium japonicum USDA 38]|uniref:hypothetical protein n=1 Tax=Bradyrhizobium japonicum TaxID=375 RepID=UPI000410CD25|nr:hypothetical protein [Bradyrhizobium japonicum]MCS3893435.1 transposase-like protein [Bradyrhizobium japonicum USDA 38]MCS3945949.1 transposase-like protein [Bradyrhizobium japonicum]
MKPSSPKSQPDRIAFVGFALYGDEWKTRLAAGLGVSRSQFFEWRRGTPKTARRDIDGALIELIDRERDAANERGLVLSRLRATMLRMIGREVA